MNTEDYIKQLEEDNEKLREALISQQELQDLVEAHKKDIAFKQQIVNNMYDIYYKSKDAIHAHCMKYRIKDPSAHEIINQVWEIVHEAAEEYSDETYSLTI